MTHPDFGAESQSVNNVFAAREHRRDVGKAFEPWPETV